MLIYCPTCETANKESAVSCTVCGRRLQTKALPPNAITDDDVVEVLSAPPARIDSNAVAVDAGVSFQSESVAPEQTQGANVRVALRVGGGAAPTFLEAKRAATSALILAIIGLFFLGLLFGILALVKASHAESLAPHDPRINLTGVRVLAWIDITVGVILLFVFLS